MLPKRTIQIGSAGLAALVLSAGVYLGAHALEQESPFLNLEVVEPGVLLRSAQPRLGDLERLRREYGVRTILSLKDGEDPEVIRYAQAHGLDWIILKMKADDPPAPEQTALFFDLVQGRPIDLGRYAGVIQGSSRKGPGPAVFGRPVLMHCEGGADRSGVLTALYRIEFQGWSLEEAKADMLRHFHFWWAHPRLFHYLDQYHPQRKE